MNLNLLKEMKNKKEIIKDALRFEGYSDVEGFCSFLILTSDGQEVKADNYECTEKGLYIYGTLNKCNLHIEGMLIPYEKIISIFDESNYVSMYYSEAKVYTIK